MATVDESPCPRCHTTGVLFLGRVFEAGPVGGFSLAGVQVKVTARDRPVLCCSACGLQHRGDFDPDGRHVVFPPLTAAGEAPPVGGRIQPEGWTV